MNGWTNERRNHESEIRNLKNVINHALNFLNSDNNIIGFANQNMTILLERESKINSVNEKLNILSNKQTVLSQKLKTLLDEQMVFVQDANNLRVKIRQEHEELTKSSDLNKIRKEQAESLHTKYAGNLHSSWLGLWTPLSDEFRAGLIVTTMALFISIIILIVFLRYSGYISLKTGQIMIGGFGLKKTRILDRTS